MPGPAQDAPLGPSAVAPLGLPRAASATSDNSADGAVGRCMSLSRGPDTVCDRSAAQSFWAVRVGESEGASTVGREGCVGESAESMIMIIGRTRLRRLLR